MSPRVKDPLATLPHQLASAPAAAAAAPLPTANCALKIQLNGHLQPANEIASSPESQREPDASRLADQMDEEPQVCEMFILAALVAVQF